LEYKQIKHPISTARPASVHPCPPTTRTTAMAVLFPNFEIEKFMWRGEEIEKKKVGNELEKFLLKPNLSRTPTPNTNIIHVVWPKILSSDCSTWLSTRKAESDKKQSEKEKEKDNPWLIKDGEISAVNLANNVREGLLRARDGLENNNEKKKNNVESRIILPMTEDIPTLAREEKEDDKITRSSSTVSVSSIITESEPSHQKSLAEEVRIGLLMAAGKMSDDDLDLDITIEEDVESETETPNMDHEESHAEMLKKSLLSINFSSPGTPKKSFSENESKSESLDNWIMDDNQSDASIVTLDTITDSGDLEDFDDFADMKDELSKWIINA